MAAHCDFEKNPLVVTEVMRPRKPYDLEAPVVNESSERIRLVGALEYCAGSCFSGRGIPTVIEAGGRGRVWVHVQPGGPGPLSGELTFYTDRPSQPTLTIIIEGSVQEDKAADATFSAAKP